jgi:glycosyltransferase involved in cell wall biosynthesis
MRRAAARGHRVLYVHTGDFAGRDVYRFLRRRDRSALAGFVRPVEVAPGIMMCKALNVLPRGHTYRISRAVDSRLTAVVLRRRRRRLPSPVVLWIYDPSASAMAGSCGEAFAVYDCVDDYPEQAGESLQKRHMVTVADHQAASRAKLVFATASSLYERHQRTNARTHLVPNVGDYDHFAPAADPGFASDELAGLAHPVVGFAGNLMSSKVDFPLLETLARERPDWTLLLIGPVRADAQEALERVLRHENVRWLGPKEYDELPKYVAAFDVGLIPYLANTYTQSCFPLKLYEYLAAGKPVVASGLPELAGREPDVVVANDASSFIAAIEASLGLLSPHDRSRRMAIAARNTWDSRAERLLGLVTEAFGA